MKLLFDENLSRKLVQRLADLSAHVVGVDLMNSPDGGIWEIRKSERIPHRERRLDFYDLCDNSGTAAESSLAATLDHPTADAERVLRREAIRIAKFVEDPELGVLVLDRD